MMSQDVLAGSAGMGFRPGVRAVDLAHLSKVTFGDRALEREVLHLFLRQSAVLVERMQTAADGRAFAVAAHTLKGSARGIGAWPTAEAAEAAELAAASDNDLRARALQDVVAAVGIAGRLIEELIAPH